MMAHQGGCPIMTAHQSHKKNVLIIGAGGVAQVVAHKCAMNNDISPVAHYQSVMPFTIAS